MFQLKAQAIFLSILDAILNIFRQIFQAVSSLFSGAIHACKAGDTGNFTIKIDSNEITREWRCCGGNKCPESMPCFENTTCGFCRTNEDCNMGIMGKACISIQLNDLAEEFKQYTNKTVTISETFSINRCGCSSDSDCSNFLPKCDGKWKICIQS